MSTPDYPNIRAVADNRGTFVQTTLGTVFLKITQMSGLPVDPDQISLTITDPNHNVALDASENPLSGIVPVKITTGFYFYDWNVLYNQTPGTYYITWSYVINGQPYSEFQTVTVAVAASLNPQTLYAGIVEEVRQTLTYMIPIAQFVPVYTEPARRIDPTFANYYWTFPRWNQSARGAIYVNKQPVEAGITVNYFKGLVTFDTPLTKYDVVEADYNFRWFTDEELDTFLSMAISKYNTSPPYTNQDWTNVPPNFFAAILELACSFAIRNLMLRLITMEAKLVFGGPDAAREMFGQLETLKKNYEDQAKLQLDNKAKGPYVGLTKMISVPEYSLPGGRSRWFRYLFSGGSS